MINLLAIDPGTNTTGLAFFQDKKLIKLLTIYTKESERYERTRDIVSQLMDAVDKGPLGFDYNSSELVVVCEEPLLQGKANNSMQRLLGSLEFCFNSKMNYIHPMSIKKAMGTGKLDKEEVAFQAGQLLLLNKMNVTDFMHSHKSKLYDETDAVAIGLTYLIQKGEINAIESGKRKKSTRRKHCRAGKKRISN